MTVASDFIAAHTTNTDGRRSMTQKDYLKFAHDNHQLSETALKAARTMNAELLNGGIELAASDLATNIAAAKSAGEDPSDLKAQVRISRPDGQVTVSVLASRTTPNPKTGERITRHGVVKLKAKLDSMIDKDAASATADAIRAAMA